MHVPTRSLTPYMYIHTYMCIIVIKDIVFSPACLTVVMKTLVKKARGTIELLYTRNRTARERERERERERRGRGH